MVGVSGIPNLNGFARNLVHGIIKKQRMAAAI
jgi:hypothetical protein